MVKPLLTNMLLICCSIAVVGWFLGQWWLAHCASWSVPIHCSALLKSLVLIIGWDPVHIWHNCKHCKPIQLGHIRFCLLHSDLRRWRSSTPLWSRTIRPDGVHVQSQRSLRTCLTSLSAKEIVWERFVLSFQMPYSQIILRFFFFATNAVCCLSSGCWLDWSNLPRQEIHKWVTCSRCFL